MKKILSIILLVLIIFPSVSYGDTLRDVQQYIFNTAPVSIRDYKYTLTGEIKDIYHVKNYHWEMIVAVDEERAIKRFESEYPYFIAEFSVYEDEEMPFQIGDTVTVCGDINSIYSSFATPMINSYTINDIDVH